MNSKEINYKNVCYPPGGILMWIIIFIEIITFCMALFVAVLDSKNNPEMYFVSSSKLNITLGTINTFVLLLSGYFMAQGLHFFKKDAFKKANTQFNWGLVLGVIFITIKTVEYFEKLNAGYGLDYNNFFSFYWLLTGFHLIHVFVGIIIMLLLKHKLSSKSIEDVEAGTTFWHMCDLIWLMLYPVLYLVFRIV